LSEKQTRTRKAAADIEGVVGKGVEMGRKLLARKAAIVGDEVLAEVVKCRVRIHRYDNVANVGLQQTSASASIERRE